jgi:hypothetical protein
MPRKLRPRRPNHATVVAYLALFVALGGTGAYAANTVFSADIVDGEVKSIDIGNNEIGSSDVKDNSINTFDVHSFLGVDIADGTVTSADVADTSSLGPNEIHEENLLFANTIASSDLGTGSVHSAEVADGTLEDEDIAQSTHVHFQAAIPAVPAHSCVQGELTGINASGDHLLLTPDYFTNITALIFSVQYLSSANGRAYLQACNPNNTNINASTGEFNLLVIGAD